jgi:hypothetical protein
MSLQLSIHLSHTEPAVITSSQPPTGSNELKQEVAKEKRKRSSEFRSEFLTNSLEDDDTQKATTTIVISTDNQNDVIDNQNDDSEDSDNDSCNNNNNDNSDIECNIDNDTQPAQSLDGPAAKKRKTTQLPAINLHSLFQRKNCFAKMQWFQVGEPPYTMRCRGLWICLVPKSKLLRTVYNDSRNDLILQLTSSPCNHSASSTIDSAPTTNDTIRQKKDADKGDHTEANDALNKNKPFPLMQHYSFDNRAKKHAFHVVWSAVHGHGPADVAEALPGKLLPSIRQIAELSDANWLECIQTCVYIKEVSDYLQLSAKAQNLWYTLLKHLCVRRPVSLHPDTLQRASQEILYIQKNTTSSTSCIRNYKNLVGQLYKEVWAQCHVELCTEAALGKSDGLTLRSCNDCNCWCAFHLCCNVYGYILQLEYSLIKRILSKIAHDRTQSVAAASPTLFLIEQEGEEQQQVDGAVNERRHLYRVKVIVAVIEATFYPSDNTTSDSNNSNINNNNYNNDYDSSSDESENNAIEPNTTLIAADPSANNGPAPLKGQLLLKIRPLLPKEVQLFEISQQKSSNNSRRRDAVVLDDVQEQRNFIEQAINRWNMVRNGWHGRINYVKVALQP